MKLSKILFYLFVLLALNACKNNSERGSDNNTPVNQETIEINEKEQVQTIVKQLNDAIVNPEKETLNKLTSDDLSYGHSSGLIQNKAEFIEDLLYGDFDFISIDISHQSIDISENVAIVRHIFDSEAKKKEDPVSIHIGNILIFQKKNSKWKLLARQAYSL